MTFQPDVEMRYWVDHINRQSMERGKACRWVSMWIKRDVRIALPALLPAKEGQVLGEF